MIKQIRKKGKILEKEEKKTTREGEKHEINKEGKGGHSKEEGEKDDERGRAIQA